MNAVKMVWSLAVGLMAAGEVLVGNAAVDNKAWVSKQAAANELGVSAAVRNYVTKSVLPFSDTVASSSKYVDRELEELDIACDDRWCALETKAEYDAYRIDLRRKMFDALGKFPDRTPLNARTVARLKRDGYVIEKVIFESMPGLLVTANLFIPDGEGRRPAVVMSCGHSGNGKDCKTYLRACVIAAKQGFVTLMFDPYNQGERVYKGQWGSTRSHTQLGLRANLIDWSAPLLRIWDGMRAIDYILSRPEVDPLRLGYMGQSGGGTMTALMEAADDRIRVACPSCFLTSLRELCDHMGPQDGEQNIYGQLSFGLNHTGYVLIPDIPIAVTCKFSDMFPYAGVRTLFRTVRTVERNVGLGERAFLNAAPGPHGWTETTEQSSVKFLAKHLMPECRDLKIDMDELWLQDIGYNIEKVDIGLASNEVGCTSSYSTEKAGSRHIHDIIAERFAAAEPLRKSLDLAAKRDRAKSLAKVKSAIDTGYRMKRIADTKVDGVAVSRIVVQYPKTGHALPAVCLTKEGADGEPVLITAYSGRLQGLKLAKPYLDGGHPVIIADVTGVGEIGREMYFFYGAKERPDEGLGAMCFLMGEPLVGRRATDMLVFADVVSRSFGGKKPILVAEGPLAIAAAHAVAADPGSFASVKLANRPLGWFEVLAKGSKGKDFLYYADIVPTAALRYDWPELL